MELSVVIPLYNEQEKVAPILTEIGSKKGLIIGKVGRVDKNALVRQSR